MFIQKSRLTLASAAVHIANEVDIHQLCGDLDRPLGKERTAGSGAPARADGAQGLAQRFLAAFSGRRFDRATGSLDGM